MIKYDTYKPSGIEWLGDIPSHWDIEKVKWIFRHVTQMAEKNNDYELLSVYTDIGVKPRKELEDRGNKATTTDNYWIVKKGDIIVNKLLAWMGAVGLSNYDGVTSPAYDVLRAIKDIDVRYYNYIFRSSQTLSEFKKRSKGIMEMRLRLYFDELGQILFPIPPKDEQKAIADFLDKKCESIDTYILKQKELIELLKEKKTSLINDAVIKGLDKKVEYKDSAIEWLGEIAKHWEVKKLKYNVKSLTEKSDSLEFKIGLENVESKTAKFINSEESPFSGEGILFDSGNVLFGKLRPYLAKVYIPNKKGLCVSEFLVLETKKIFNQYLKYMFLNLSFIDYIDSSTYGTKMPRANWSFIGNTFIPIPPKEEQKQIVSHIEKESKKIDDAISHIQEELKLLEEYKQSIISQAVTGKIKVC